MSALLVVAVSRALPGGGRSTGLVAADAPVVTADDLGLTRGDGCFEGLRLVARADGGAEVPNLGAHLARMQRSARSLDLPDDPAPWAQLLDLAAGEWAAHQAGSPGEAAVKLSMTRGLPQSPGEPVEPTVVVTVSAMDVASLAARRDGVRVASMTRGYGPEAFAGAPWLLGGVKTLSYAVHTAAQREAVRRGADDALLTAADGSLLEGPTSAVLWVPGGGGIPRLRTVAPGSNGILGSTSQQLLFERAQRAGWDATATTGTLADLRSARAVLLASAVRGPVAVRELDGQPLPVDTALVSELQELAGF
ncbi:aminotransferase class IV [Quadrisphaera sp. INWT6]|uniref:aminotransferase class IV n=1 Tax=Quadrisphaera sp. INWT6 TaxID=2596917 RepID=UPI0018920EA1|nr:aminotransferase class IV [Quadrisphaera sp. INWT6]MBF5081295.1 aminodeoxychorismate lyase [Quadrisphaera sp. INWT6]